MIEPALAFLQTNPLRYLVQLKYLRLYADKVNCHYIEQGGSRGVLLSHPAAMTSWDSSAYPHANHILLPAASDQSAATLLLNHALEYFASGEGLVFKFCEESTRRVFERFYPMRFARALISYTTQTARIPSEDVEVVVSQIPGEDCIQLYLENGYSRSEIDKFFAEGALSFTFYEGNAPVCSCLAYRNFGDIWEIAGVRTVDRAQRRGYARRVVLAALRTLAQRNYIPRYQVEATNLPSVRLAESVGLEICLRFEHYLG
jgi:ribosomal protein S18 acetylase RimI-like enzyme